MWTLAFSLARKNWQVLAVAALIGVVWLRLSYITGERDDAIASLKQTTELIRDNALKAETEKALLAKQGAEQRKKDQAESIKNAQLIGNAFYGMVKDAKNETKNVRITSAATVNDLREQLFNQSAIVASRGRAEDDALHATKENGNPAISGRTEEESAEFYRAAFIGAAKDLKICKLSGASCASDFNECRVYVLGEQGRIGVSPLQ